MYVYINTLIWTDNQEKFKFVPINTLSWINHQTQAGGL